jgi:hypothetical protein
MPDIRHKDVSNAAKEMFPFPTGYTHLKKTANRPSPISSRSRTPGNILGFKNTLNSPKKGTMKRL